MKLLGWVKEERNSGTVDGRSRVDEVVGMGKRREELWNSGTVIKGR